MNCDVSEAISFVCACAFTFVSVAAGVEGILQCQKAAAPGVRTAVIVGDVAADHRDTVVLGVENVFDLQGDAETVVEQGFV